MLVAMVKVSESIFLYQNHAQQTTLRLFYQLPRISSTQRLYIRSSANVSTHIHVCATSEGRKVWRAWMMLIKTRYLCLGGVFECYWICTCSATNCPGFGCVFYRSLGAKNVRWVVGNLDACIKLHTTLVLHWKNVFSAPLLVILKIYKI